MAWRDQYQQGSFRGAAFLTQRHDAEFGRRGEDHDYPFRDVPWFEDLGRKGRAWAISCLVLGADYMAARDALISACEAQGPGTLVHPWLGTFQAQLVGMRLSESVEEGGLARFDLAFVEPGIAVTASVSADTAAAALATADTTDANAGARFSAGFVAVGEPDFVQAGSSGFIVGVANAIAAAGQQLGGSGAGLRTFHSGLAQLAGAATLIGVPGTLASVMQGMIGALSLLGGQGVLQIGGLRAVMAAVSAMPVAVPATAARARESANQQAAIDLVVSASAGAVVRVVAGVDFASYDDAIGVRDALAQDLSDQSDAAHDRGNAPLADDLDALRRAMVTDVTARGGSLQRLFTIIPAACRPALALAWGVYLDAGGLDAEVADLIARNRVVHPLFVPAGPLSMLTPASVQAGGINGL